jgi:23S rRNA A1618 N6-methylase RlmF
MFRNLKNGIANVNGTFDAIVCNPNFLARYEAAYTANPKETVLTGQAAQLAALGYNVYQYAGRPLIGDVSCPANVAYAFDIASSSIYTRATSETQSMNGMNFVVGQIASDTATAMLFEIAVFPQLAFKNRLNLGRILLT